MRERKSPKLKLTFNSDSTPENLAAKRSLSKILKETDGFIMSGTVMKEVCHLLAGNRLLRVEQAERALSEDEEYVRLAPKGEFAAQARELVEKIKAKAAQKK